MTPTPASVEAVLTTEEMLEEGDNTNRMSTYRGASTARKLVNEDLPESNNLLGKCSLCNDKAERDCDDCGK